MTTAKPQTGRFWLFGLLLVAAVLIVWGNAEEARKVFLALAHGETAWVLAAVALQGAFYLLHAGLFQAAFTAVGVKSRFWNLVPLWFGSIFVNTVAPLLGATVFVTDAIRRGESGTRAAAATILVKVADMGTLVLVVGAGFIYLGMHHHLKPVELLASGVLLIIVLGWAGTLLLGLWRPEILRRLLTGVNRAVTGIFARFRRPAPLAADWPETTTAEFAETARLLHGSPRRMLPAFGFALTAHLVDLASLYALLRAFGVPVSAGVLVAGFAIGVLFWVVSITPEGIGTVEGAMTITFVTLGISTAQAAAVALTFRGLAFYLPLIIGIFCARRLSLLTEREEAVSHGPLG